MPTIVKVPLLPLLFGLSAPVDRRTYLLAGLSLAALKYALDFTLVWATTGRIWSLIGYLSPLADFRAKALEPAPEGLLWLMAACSLPFAWIGLSMSVRRAVDAGRSPWWGIAFLLPFVNWIAIAVLCLLPSRERWVTGDAPARILRDAGVLQSKIRVVLIGVVSGVLLTFAILWVSVYLLKEYGAALFIGAPLMVGAVVSFLLNRRTRCGMAESVAFSILSLVIAGASMLLFALEGIICLLMAAVPALFMCAAGAALGRTIAQMIDKSGASPSRGLMASVLLLPLLAGIESRLGIVDSSPPLHEVASSIEIDATPAEVWEHVIDFPELGSPGAWVERIGIAYPIRARLEGRGVGAVRYCEFSTGPFVEPITVWEPGKRLAFDVASQPPPLKEWSPYHNLHPPHLDGYFRSKRGEFRLIALSEGRTRLEGSTWYELDVAPVGYWSMLADFIVHRIHLRVLRQVRRHAEE